MTVSNTTNKHYYNGTGAQVSFPYAFKVFSSSDLTVYVDNILKTVDVDYSVSDVGEESGGNVVFTSAPASGTGNVAILRKLPLSQLLDLVQYGKFDAEVIEESFDRLVYVAQQLQEASDRTIRFAATVSDGNPQEITDTATDRAGKVLAYDSAGDLTVAQELGEWKGDWITATQYYVRDLIKDSATDNVYIALTNHVSAAAIGTDIGSNLGLVIDAAAVAANAATATTQAGIATTQAGIATTQAGLATTKAGEASTSATNASTSATNAGTSETNASTSATNAGTSETNASTSATNASTSETNASTSATAAGTSATNSATSATAAGTSATNAATSATAAGTSATTANTKAGEAASSATAAATSETNAGTSANTANTRANAADTSATNAATSATASATSATNAANSAADAASTAASLASLDLSSIAASITDTAVDVFVYDTSKDSDGGAWRKRTQHTSWYNETLNTATRGSRKEFPSVAVIVAESNQVTIYDGDDPSMPMWMVFNPYSRGAIGRVGISRTSVSCVNGVVAVGNSSDTLDGLHLINFISDSGSVYAPAHGYGRANPSIKSSGIISRNADFYTSTAGGYATFTAYRIAGNVNDVAMTVLPNAPIDSATGLPIPTIAVATAGGVSVIKDDGSVVDSSSTANFLSLGISKDNKLIGAEQSTGRYYNFGGIGAITADGFIGTYLDQNTTPALLDYTWFNSVSIYGATGDDKGVSLLDEDTTTPTEGSVAYITSDYNTGWMNGDIKLAALSDTDDTDVVGSELVTNGTFDSDVSGWTAGKLTGAADGILSVDTNRLKITNGSPDGYGTAYQSVTVEVGKTYTFSVNFTVGNASKRIVRLGTGLYNTSYVSDAVSSGATDEVITHTFVATSTNLYISLANYGTAGNYSIWDNVSLRLADSDRSVNGNGLQVHGTIQKTFVDEV